MAALAQPLAFLAALLLMPVVAVAAVKLRDLEQPAAVEMAAQKIQQVLLELSTPAAGAEALAEPSQQQQQAAQAAPVLLF